MYRKAEDLKKNSYEENAKKYFAKGTENEGLKDIEWQNRCESEEMADAAERFINKYRLSKSDPLWKKINDPDFWGKHGDTLAAHEAENYDEVFRIAKAKAEREMELEARKRYIEAMQRERSPMRESFQQYQKRVHGGR